MTLHRLSFWEKTDPDLKSVVTKFLGNGWQGVRLLNRPHCRRGSKVDVGLREGFEEKTRNMQTQSEKGSEWPHHAIFI